MAVTTSTSAVLKSSRTESGFVNDNTSPWPHSSPSLSSKKRLTDGISPASSTTSADQILSPATSHKPSISKPPNVNMNFQFVNISNPEQARDPSLLKRVRQHVQNPGVRKKGNGDANHTTVAKTTSVKKRRADSDPPVERRKSSSASATSSVVSKRSKTGPSDGVPHFTTNGSEVSYGSNIATNGSAVSYGGTPSSLQSSTSSPRFHTSVGESFAVINSSTNSWGAASNSSTALSPSNFPYTPSPTLGTSNYIHGVGLDIPLGNGTSDLTDSLFPAAPRTMSPLSSNISMGSFNGSETALAMPAYHSYMPFVSPVDSPSLVPSPEYATSPEYAASPVYNSPDQLDFPPLYRPIAGGYDHFNALPRPELLDSLTVQQLKQNCILYFRSPSLDKYWIPLAMKQPIFFFSTLCLSARHADMLSGNIFNPTSDALSQLVLGLLLVRGKNPKTDADDHTAAALAHVSLADSYTAIDKNPALDILKVVVERRGGCHEFNKFVSKTMVIATLASAVLRSTQPDEIFLEEADRILARRGDRVTTLESPICYNVHTGFPTLRASIHCCDMLFELLRRMRELSDLISPDASGRSSPHRYNLQRDDMRRYILQLPSANQMADFHGKYIYEACRITAVIFERACYNRQPLPEAVRNTTLISELKEALERTHLAESWGDMSGVLFWVTMIGASAAKYHLFERGWLVGLATRITIINAFETGIWIIAALHRLTQLQKWLDGGHSANTSGVFEVDAFSPCQSMFPMEGNMMTSMNSGVNTNMSLMDYTNHIL